jgi:two-component system cell cycle response regulator
LIGLLKSNKKTAHAKILVVDDEPDCISIIRCRLEWSHFEVITATNGKEAIQLAETEKPDLILLDTNMPVMNGHETLERLKKNPSLKNIPVIMVTALCEKNDIAKASSFGIEDYVTKPVDFTGLLEKISSILKNKANK